MKKIRFTFLLIFMFLKVVFKLFSVDENQNILYFFNSLWRRQYGTYRQIMTLKLKT